MSPNHVIHMPNNPAVIVTGASRGSGAATTRWPVRVGAGFFCEKLRWNDRSDDINLWFWMVWIYAVLSLQHSTL